jgi:transposase
MTGEFWLSEAQWGAIEPLLPKNQPGARRTDDRRVISGTVHVLKTSCRWQDCPAIYGPSTTVYNRFRRWTMRGIWRRLFEALAPVWSQLLMEHPYRVIRRMRYGPSSTWKRHDDRGGPSSDTA